MSAHARASVGVARNTRKALTFPQLTIPELLACMEELGLTNLKSADLQEPKPDVVQKIFEHLIEFVMQKSKEELTQPHFACLDAVKWPVRRPFEL